MALMNATANTPIVRDFVMCGMLRCIGEVLSTPNENHEQLLLAIMEEKDTQLDKQDMQSRNELIGLYRAVVENIPAFREGIKKTLERGGARLPDWV